MTIVITLKEIIMGMSISVFILIGLPLIWIYGLGKWWYKE